MHINLDDIHNFQEGLILKLNDVCPNEQQAKNYQLNKQYSKLIYVNNEIPIGYINCDLCTTRKTDNGIFVYSIVLLPSYLSVTNLNILKHVLDYVIDLGKTNHQRYITLYLPWDYDSSSNSAFNDTVRWFIDNGDFKPLFEDILEPNKEEGRNGIQKVMLRRRL